MSEQENIATDHDDDGIPPEVVFSIFKDLTSSGMKPSAALRKIMLEYPSPFYNPDVVMYLLKLAYPDGDIQMGGFQFKIRDANYPHADALQMSDADFDQGVAEMLARAAREAASGEVWPRILD